MSEFLVDLASGKTDEKGQSRLLGRLLTTSGVIQSTALTVSAQASPDMTVKVSGSAASDDVVFINSSGDTYHGWNTANYNVTILSNSSGVSKTDAVIAYADTAAGSATANNPGALKFIAVRGASGAPSDAELNTATSNKPWLRLATVVVGNGVSSINSGNITDVRIQTWINQPISAATFKNPYKFRARRAAAFNTSAAAFAKVTFDTEDYDTGNNFDAVTNFRFTAPIAGFYHFDAQISLTNPNTEVILALYKNGSILQRGQHAVVPSGSSGGAVLGDTVQAAASDYFEIFVYATNAVAAEVTAGTQPVFSGYLVSQG